MRIIRLLGNIEYKSQGPMFVVYKGDHDIFHHSVTVKPQGLWVHVHLYILWYKSNTTLPLTLVI